MSVEPWQPFQCSHHQRRHGLLSLLPLKDLNRGRAEGLLAVELCLFVMSVPSMIHHQTSVLHDFDASASEGLRNLVIPYS